MRLVPIAVLTGLFAFSVLGCQGLERVDECRAVAKIANPVLTEIERDRAVVVPANYRAVATKYEALALSLTKMPIRTKRVAEAVNDYERVLREAARDARAFSDALDSKEPGRIAVEHVTAARTVRHESTALSRLDTACRSPR